MYDLRYMPPAKKYFKKLKERGLINAYKETLEKIAADPYAGEAKIGDLAGIYCMDVFYSKINYAYSPEESIMGSDPDRYLALGNVNYFTFPVTIYNYSTSKLELKLLMISRPSARRIKTLN